MARTKRGKHVWQCAACGYWAERAWNVKRHNVTVHAGEAPVQPAYATLVIEPSWHVTPIADSTHSVPAAASHTPAPYFMETPPSAAAATARMYVASDTLLPSSTLQQNQQKPWPFIQRLSNNNRAETKRKNHYQQQSAEEGGEEEPLDPVKDMTLMLEELEKFKEKINKLLPGTGSSPWSIPAAAAALSSSSYFYRVSPASGYISSSICEKCFTFSITSIPVDKDPVEYLLSPSPSSSLPSSSSSPHRHDAVSDGVCNGERQFESDQAKQQYKEQIEWTRTSALFQHVKAQIQGRNAVLGVRNLGSVSPPSSVSKFNIELTAGDLVSRAIKAAATTAIGTTTTITAVAARTTTAEGGGEETGTTTTGIFPITDLELWQFLHYVQATVAIFEVKGEHESSEYYGISVYGQTTVENAFSAEVGKLISNCMKFSSLQSAPS